MKNKDRFSGALLNNELHIRTGQEVYAFKPADFSDIVFIGNEKVSARTLVEDKTYITGDLVEQQLQIKPESVSLLSPCIGYIAKLKFNASKLIMEPKLPAEVQKYDSDGDSVPDAIDACPHTACPCDVDKRGCARQK